MNNPDNDELIAYLDGELDPPTSQQVEERLKHDPAYRQALALYERSWDMLDRLERSSVGENFTRTTLEMVSRAAAEEEQQQQTLPAARRFDPRRAGIVVLVAVAALLLGYAGGRALWPDPNRELLADLPILEDLDLYEQAGSIDFLHMLAGTGLFGDAAARAKAPPGMAVPEALADRRAEIARMTLAEEEHLARKLERFTAYNTYEKQRLRDLYDSFNRDAAGRQLREVLIRYHEWLDTLMSNVREELNDLKDDERLARVILIKTEQDAHLKKELEEAAIEQDLAAIIGWLEDFTWQDRQALLSSVSDKRRHYIEELDEKQQHRAVLRIWMLRLREPGRLDEGLARLAKADFSRLPAALAPSARAEFEAAHEPADKAKLILRWGQTAAKHRINTSGLRQFLPPVSPTELQRFGREELSRPLRVVVGPMPRYERFLEWTRLYFLSTDRLAEMKPAEITTRHPSHGDGPPPRRQRPAAPSGSE